jgi:hypothetical protein
MVNAGVGYEEAPVASHGKSGVKVAAVTMVTELAEWGLPISDHA